MAMMTCQQYFAIAHRLERVSVPAATNIVRECTVSLRRFLLACSVPFAAATLSPAVAANADVFALSGAPDGVSLSAMRDDAPMRVILSLPLRDEGGARAFAKAVSTPGTPQYGHFLTPAEFGARFGADAATYEGLRSWAGQQGLSVGPRLDSRAEISLGGTAGQFASLFGTHFVSFATPHGDGYTVTNTPRLPDALAGHVEGVIGLTSQGKLGLLYRRPQVHPDVGTGVNGSGYAPADLKTAYDIPAQKGTKTEVIAIFEQDGYKQSDLTTFEKAYKLPNVPNQQVGINGSGTGVSGNGAEIEADLDVEMAIGLNPALSNIIVYIDQNDSFQTALLDGINLVAQDNKASVFSISYGQDESMQGKPAIKAEGKALIQLQTAGYQRVRQLRRPGRFGPHRLGPACPRSGFAAAADKCRRHQPADEVRSKIWQRGGLEHRSAAGRGHRRWRVQRVEDSELADRQRRLGGQSERWVFDQT